MVKKMFFLFKFFKWVGEKLKGILASFINFLVKIGLSLTVVIGVGVVLATLFLSFQLAVKVFPAAPNLIASAGGCVGVLLIMLVYSEEKAKRKVGEALMGKRLEDTERELKEVKKDREKLKKEFEKQKNNMLMYAGIKLLNPIKQIALLEIAVNLNKPRRETLKTGRSFETGVMIKKVVKEQEEYKSELIVEHTEKLGIDLEKMYVELQEESIIVSGVECIRIGTTNIKTKWQQNEIRRQTIIKDRKGNIVDRGAKEIIEGHEKLGIQMKEDIRVLEEEIYNKSKVQPGLKKIIENIGRMYIKELLIPMAAGRRIDFKEVGNKTNQTPLLDFIQDPLAD
ncbi:hypothetical protein FACS189485_19120 [Spirochaetia bacterium]|nr:hypothetical protein FACS189485_19120 [Spirochaetia bacterium]